MTVRTLPIQLLPGVGEGLDSYLELLAQRAGAAWADMLDAVGLDTDGRGRTLGVYQWLSELTPAQQQSLSSACGIDPSELRPLTMAALIPAAAATSPTTTPLVPPHLSPARSRFCPQCLAQTGGRWQLWWRLRWAFACPHHRCLLADTCPECGRWQRTRPLPNDLIPVPGRCARKADTSHGRDLRRCGAALSTTTTLRLREDHRVLAVQSAILQTLGHDVVSHGVYTGDPVSVRLYLADLAAVAGRILGYADPSDLEDLVPADLLDTYRWAKTSFASRERRSPSLGGTAVATAIAAVLAVDVLCCRDPRTAGQQLRWLVSASRRRGLAVTGSNIGWSRHASDALLAVQLCAITPFLPPSDQLRYRCAADYPRRPDPTCERWRSIPAAVWPGIRLFFLIPMIGFEQLGSALSVALRLVGTRITLSQAATSLGSVTTAHSVSRVLQGMHRDHRWPDMLAALTGLAELLDAGHCPIDYAKRRDLPFASFLPEEEWRQICVDTATPVGRAVRIRLVRCWVFERVIGSPVRHCTSAIDDPQFRSKLRALPLWMPPHLVSSLDHSARRFLDRHGHGGEPLTWQPDEHLFEQCGLTRTAPTVNTAAVHEAVRNGVRRLSDIADEYGVSIDYLRYTREMSLATDSSTDRAAGHVGVLPALRAQLSRETFLDLYVTRRHGFATIAEKYGVSRQTLTRLAHIYDVELRAASRPRRTW
ncbi:TniQ family protein [Mycobacterium sp.]|uniref:TniQ family protein n=1 Tax=Mycobacterium sp. TaxID=1785 RepID=UPI003F99CE9C